jgi:predicted transcriptional regulator
MSQDSVYKLLKKKRRYMSIKEISKALKIRTTSANTSLLKLLKTKEVRRIYSFSPERNTTVSLWKTI